ncbi:MAG: hypothetical protein AB1679_12240 [Actinomycetota bacterium]
MSAMPDEVAELLRLGQEERERRQRISDGQRRRWAARKRLWAEREAQGLPRCGCEDPHVLAEVRGVVEGVEP